MTRGVLLAIIGGVLAACGSAAPDAVAPTTTTGAVSTTVAATITTTDTPASTVSEATTTTAGVERYEIVDGDFRGPESFTVMVGETYQIEVVSDVSGQLHVHGYDLLFELAADEPTLVELVASAPGVFEVELEGSHTHLFDVEVRG